MTPVGVTRSACVAVIALAVAATQALASCSGQRRDEEHVGRSSSPAETIIDSRERDTMLKHLTSALSCQSEDQLFDDLSSYDSMRGLDCYSESESTFVRVYEHSRSVNQVLQDWAPTITGKRHLVRGENWFALGSQSALAALEPPKGQKIISRSVGVPVPASSDQSNVTTCVQFVVAWTLKYVERPLDFGKEIGGLEEQLPGVEHAIRDIVRGDVARRLESVRDPDRRAAALTPEGPAMKSFCRSATNFMSTGDPHA